MDTIVTAGEAADALRINQLHQVQTGDAYWMSGGDVTPGTASTQIEVDIASGQAHINDSEVSWAADSVALSSASSDPRVDVVYVQEDASLNVVTGTPASYRPNTDEDGNTFTPAPFEHWEPAPDDGSSVLGLPLACVLVKPTTADSTDLASNQVQDRRMGKDGSGAFVVGNGEDNGSTTITVNDADFKLQDTTEDVPEWFWRDFDAGLLYFGTPYAKPTARSDVHLDGHALRDYRHDIVTSRPSGFKGRAIHREDSGFARDAEEVYTTRNGWQRRYYGQQWGSTDWKMTTFDGGEESHHMVQLPNRELRIVSVSAREDGMNVDQIKILVKNGNEDTTFLDWDPSNHAGVQTGSVASPLATVDGSSYPNVRIILKNAGTSQQDISGEVRYVYV